MTQRKKRPVGIAVQSEYHVMEIAKKNAVWKGVPPAYQEPPEGEDPQERLDLLSEQEKLDCKDFRQGRMVVCEFTDRIQKEDAHERQQAGLEEFGEEEFEFQANDQEGQQAQMYG